MIARVQYPTYITCTELSGDLRVGTITIDITYTFIQLRTLYQNRDSSVFVVYIWYLLYYRSIF
jgi:hypothetical protein